MLVLTTYAFDQWGIEALRAGAAGYLLKDAPWETILRAIYGTVQGLRFIDPEVAGVLIERAVGQEEASEPCALEQLTAREIDVLHCLTRGLTNAEIASELHLSAGTVRNYLSVIFAKLGVTDRTQAAIVVLRRGLIG